MKKIINSLTLLSVTLMIVATGCLKDKGFEAHQYGINDPDTQPVGIGFPQGSTELNSRAIDFVSTPQVINDPVVSLFATNPAPQDLHVNLVANPALVTAYNTAHGTNLIAMPATAYNIPSLKVTIPAGQRFGSIKINIPNALLLNPLASYGFGFTISSIDEAGYLIPANLKNFLMVVNVKNKYDGSYRMNINTIGWDAYGISDGVARNWPAGGLYFITTSGNTVDMFDNYAFGTYIQPAFTTAGAATGFGATSPRFVFNLATDKLIDVFNTTPDDGRGRAFQLNGAAPPGTNYFDPVTHNIYSNYIMKQNGRPNQIIIANFTYLGPRP